jgi:archaeal type IV pilus assembly protein PilA
MNVFGRKERSWRKAQKRAVSPIIATILLVAITVVLAAVLYVLISGLTHGPGSTPIGTAFAAGNPVPSNTGWTGASSACATTSTTLAAAIKTSDYVYTLTVESSTVSMGSVLLQVKTATGTFAAAAVGFYVTNIGGLVAACAAGLTGSMSSAAQFVFPTDVGATSATPLTTVYTISIDMGAASPTGQGYTFDAAGQGSYSGTTGALALP